MTLPDEEPDVIDGLLEEMLGGAAPPDVTARVLERLSLAPQREQLAGWGRAAERARTELDEPSPWLVKRGGAPEPSLAGRCRVTRGVSVGRFGELLSRSRGRTDLRLAATAMLALVALAGAWWLRAPTRFAAVESIELSSLEPSELESRRLWAELNRQAGRAASAGSQAADSDAGRRTVDPATGDLATGDAAGTRVAAGGASPVGAAGLGAAGRDSVESIFFRPSPETVASQPAAVDRGRGLAGSGPAEVRTGEVRGLVPESSLVRPLPDQEVVRWIDTLMEQTWQRAQVPAPERVAGEIWQRRVGQLAWGELPIDESSGWLAGSAASRRKPSGEAAGGAAILPVGWDRSDSLDQQLGWLFEQVDQRQFAEHWAIELTQKWLTGGGQLDSAAVAMFTEELAGRLHRGHSIGRIQKRIMRDAVLALESCNTDPTSPMVIPLLQAAEHGSTELVDRLYSRWSGSAFSCGRCHHARPVSAAREDDFWGLAALLQPLGVKRHSSDSGDAGHPSDAVLAALHGRQLTEQPPRVLFRERSDGRLIAAVPRLPGGPAIDGELELRARLELLADWLRSDVVIGPGLVNWVWQQMLGQPLVPAMGVADVPVDEVRQELMQLLVTQLRAHGGDMRRLVVWIAASRPMWAKQVDLEAGQLLLMGRQSSDVMRRSDLHFATFRNRRLGAAGRPLPLLRLELLAQAAAIGRASDRDRRVLAQSDPQAVREQSDASTTAVTSAADPWLMLHWQRVPVADGASLSSAGWRAWLERLSDSGLDWQGQLQHVYMATAAGPLQPRERQLADGILKNVSGDSTEALNRVMTVLLGF